MDTETQAAEVQPGEAPEGVEQGQGEASYHGLYDLSAAPEHVRPLLEAELKKVTANVDAKFREHADFRKRFEGLSEIEGLTDVPAEEVGQLLEFREIAANPEAFESWWYQVGKDLGFFDDDGTGGAPTPDDAADGDPGDQVAQLQQMIEGLTARLDEYESRGEQEKTQAAAREEIDKQLGELRDQHGEFDEALVLRLARDYLEEPDAIQRGFDDMLRITGQAQGELVDDKLDQPDPANAGGRPDTGGSAPRTFKEAQEAALARLGG